MMRGGAERRIQGMQLESDTCRARLSALQEECRKMEEMVSNMLQYKAKVDQLKQESASMKSSYEANLQKYCSHISTLERDNMVLRNQVKKMETQIHGKGDERDKSKLLLERLKMVEAENSSLVLENEQQRQQYEKCLDEIANQVVQALLAQKMLREECFKLQSRVQDLELQNKHLNLMFHQRMRMSTDTVSQVAGAHLCPVPSSTSASNGADMMPTGAGGEMTLDYMAATGSLHSMCSEIMGDDSPGKPQLSSPPPWLRDKTPSNTGTEVPSSSSPESVTSSSQSRSTPVEISDHTVHTKIETEFPATNSSPKMKHVTVSHRRSRSLERGASGPFGWMKKMGKGGTRSRRGSETQEKNYDPPRNLKQSTSADALTHFGVGNKKTPSTLLSQSMDNSSWRDSLTPERINAKGAKLLLRTTSADVDSSEKNSGICDINHQSFEAFNKSFEKLLAKNSVDDLENQSTKSSKEKQTKSETKSTSTKEVKNVNKDSKKYERKQLSPATDAKRNQQQKPGVKFQACPALRNPFAETVKSPKSPSPLPGQYYYYDYSDEDSDSQPVSRDFSTASTMSLNEILDSSQEAEVALDDDFFSDWSSICISPQKRIDLLTGQTISNNAMVSKGLGLSTSTSTSASTASSSPSSKLSSSSSDSSHNQHVDASCNTKMILGLYQPGLEFKHPDAVANERRPTASQSKPEPIYDEPYIPETETLSSPLVSKTVSQKAVTRSLTDPSVNTREVKAEIHVENLHRSFQPSPSLSPNPSQISQDQGYSSKGSYSQSSPSPSPSMSHRGTPPWLHNTKDPHAFSRNELLSLVINRDAMSGSPKSIPNGASPSDTPKLVRPGQLILAPQDKNLNFQGFSSVSSTSSEDKSPIKMFESKQTVNMESSVIEVKKENTYVHPIRHLPNNAGEPSSSSGNVSAPTSPNPLKSPTKIPPPVARKPVRAVKPEARTQQPKDEKEKTTKDDPKNFPGAGNTNMTVGFVLHDHHNVLQNRSRSDSLMENLMSNVKNSVGKHPPEYGSPLQTKICPSSDSSFENLRVERSGSKDDGYSTMSSDIHPEMMEKFCDTLTLKRSETDAHFMGNKSASLRINTNQRCVLERRNSDSILQSRDRSMDLVSDQDSAMETSVHSTTEMVTSSSSQVSTSSTDLASPTSTKVSRIARLFEATSGKTQNVNSDHSPKSSTPTKSPSSPKAFFPSSTYQQPESPRRLANEFQKNSINSNNSSSTFMKNNTSPVSPKHIKGFKGIPSPHGDKNDRQKKSQLVQQQPGKTQVADNSSKRTQKATSSSKRIPVQNSKSPSTVKATSPDTKKSPTSKLPSPDTNNSPGTNKTSTKNDKQLPRGFYKQSSTGKSSVRKTSQSLSEKDITNKNSGKNTGGVENSNTNKVKSDVKSSVSAEFALVLTPDSNDSNQKGVVLELVKEETVSHQTVSHQSSEMSVSYNADISKLNTPDVECSVVLENKTKKTMTSKGKEESRHNAVTKKDGKNKCNTVNSHVGSCGCDSSSSKKCNVHNTRSAMSSKSSCCKATTTPPSSSMHVDKKKDNSCQITAFPVSSSNQTVVGNTPSVKDTPQTKKPLIVLTNQAFRHESSGSDTDDSVTVQTAIPPQYQPIPPLDNCLENNVSTDRTTISHPQSSPHCVSAINEPNQSSSSSSSSSSLSSSYLCNTTAGSEAIPPPAIMACNLNLPNNDPHHYSMGNSHPPSTSSTHPPHHHHPHHHHHSKETSQQQQHHHQTVHVDNINNDSSNIPFLRRSHSEQNITGSRPKSTSATENFYNGSPPWDNGMPLQRSQSASQLDRLHQQFWGSSYHQHYQGSDHNSPHNPSSFSYHHRTSSHSSSSSSMSTTSHYFQRFHGYHNVYNNNHRQQQLRVENYPLLTRSLRLDLSDVTEMDEDGSELASTRDSLDTSTGQVTSDESPRLTTDDQKQFNSQFYSLCQLGSNKSLLSSSYDSKEKLSPCGLNENSASNRNSSGKEEEDEIALQEFDEISRQIASLSKTVDELNHSLSSLNSGEFEPHKPQTQNMSSWASHSTKTDVIDGYHWADDEFYLTSCNGKVILSSGNRSIKEKTLDGTESDQELYSTSTKDSSDLGLSEDARDEFYIHATKGERSSTSASPSNFDTVVRRQSVERSSDQKMVGKKLVRWTSEGNLHRPSEGDKRLSMPLGTKELEEAFTNWDVVLPGEGKMHLEDFMDSHGDSSYDDSDEDDNSLASDIGLDHMMCQRLIGPNAGHVRQTSPHVEQGMNLSQLVLQLTRENKQELDSQVLSFLLQKEALSENSKRLLNTAVVLTMNGDEEEENHQISNYCDEKSLNNEYVGCKEGGTKRTKEEEEKICEEDSNRLKVPETRDVGIDAMSGSQNSLSNSFEIHVPPGKMDQSSSSISNSSSSSSSSLSLSMSHHNQQPEAECGVNREFSQPKSSTPELLKEDDVFESISSEHCNQNMKEIASPSDNTEHLNHVKKIHDIEMTKQEQQHVSPNRTMDKVTTYSDFVADLEMNAVGEYHSPSHHPQSPRRTITNGSLTPSSLDRKNTSSCLSVSNTSPHSGTPPLYTSVQSQHMSYHHRHTIQFHSQPQQTHFTLPFHQPPYGQQRQQPHFPPRQPAYHPHPSYVNHTIPHLPQSRLPLHYTNPRPQSFPSARFNPTHPNYPSSPPPPAPSSTPLDSNPPPLPPRNPQVSRTHDGRPQVMIRPHRIQKENPERPHSFNHYLINQPKSSLDAESTNQRTRSYSVTTESSVKKEKGKTNTKDTSSSKIPRRKLKTRRELSSRKNKKAAAVGGDSGGAGSRSWRDIDVEKGTPLSDSSGGDSTSG